VLGPEGILLLSGTFDSAQCDKLGLGSIGPDEFIAVKA
jgi:hypothetical protein